MCIPADTLWKRDFADLGTFEVYYDDTYADTPLSTAYNQVHIPGANARGTNYVGTEEGVYLALGSKCLLLDAATGKTVQEFSLAGCRRRQSHRNGVFSACTRTSCSPVQVSAITRGDLVTSIRRRTKRASLGGPIDPRAWD